MIVGDFCILGHTCIVSESIAKLVLLLATKGSNQMLVFDPSPIKFMIQGKAIGLIFLR
uniref:Uncharacterized protein n=1 Tax=Utricularia reniformis TaxID=192314 RepID=A0A1Y0B443_9LAMI|nr:hypothetical protein AEK19_MT2069 [Utricularia reniformis]ART32225.1 hypothetical protein AEK19_MT2069 [Utricularia reniformis]